uniref:Ig-like domain-containing protein n=1 Tax=Astyanax mexicanus TaxID=7994 RepID=A0A3B1IFL3_ASTMX
MITVVISLCLFVTVKPYTDDLQVQTEKIGENVTIKCEESFIRDHQYSFAWFKQSYGKLPQFVVRFYDNYLKVRQPRQFIQRFNAILKGDQFVLNIQETVEEDSGTYFCVRVKSDVTEFGSGTLLIFNGKSSVLLIYLIYYLFVKKMITVNLFLSFLLIIIKKKNTDALNYAAIQFRNKPPPHRHPRSPPSRTPRVQESQGYCSVSSQVA